MWLLYDYYVIQSTSLYLPAARITSTASATISFRSLRSFWNFHQKKRCGIFDIFGIIGTFKNVNNAINANFMHYDLWGWFYDKFHG